ncbi:hypothetical protein M406DRAFT_66203 [Cryphonectria parasitica EP155]|uniref:Uncharacterized protein n=1 Tax=Cryphonectria parasitica (strain ATCC 38755 / EP155) TaxID=660469 RepID=A0A9P5CU37_CRYP1|nr:uncharacterized protein M406DRAFT_66203 [Cryphonectria parasitica EP155]KAF3769730.1 hypothetical protein M406DRAFT_66203 [Cryphonectria parasitica EP155]
MSSHDVIHITFISEQQLSHRAIAMNWWRAKSRGYEIIVQPTDANERIERGIMYHHNLLYHSQVNMSLLRDSPVNPISAVKSLESAPRAADHVVRTQRCRPATIRSSGSGATDWHAETVLCRESRICESAKVCVVRGMTAASRESRMEEERGMHASFPNGIDPDDSISCFQAHSLGTSLDARMACTRVLACCEDAAEYISEVGLHRSMRGKYLESERESASLSTEPERLLIRNKRALSSLRNIGKVYRCLLTRPIEDPSNEGTKASPIVSTRTTFDNLAPKASLQSAQGGPESPTETPLSGLQSQYWDPSSKGAYTPSTHQSTIGSKGPAFLMGQCTVTALDEEWTSPPDT